MLPLAFLLLYGKIPAWASLLLDNPGIWHPPGGAELAVSEHRAPQCESPGPWEQTWGALSLLFPTCPSRIFLFFPTTLI